MRRVIRIESGQQGIAIVSALLVAAIVAAMVMTLSERAGLWLHQVQNRQDRASAQILAFNAIDLARLTLRDDARNNQVDHLQEPWAIPIPAVNAEEGSVGGRIIEMQGFFNLSNLLKNGQIDAQEMKSLERLFVTLGLGSSLAARMETRLRQEIDIRKKAGLVASFPYVDVAALGEIPGFDPSVLDRLRDRVVILPEPTSINVNFAGPDVLAAVVPDLTLGEAGGVVSRRSGGHFRTVAEFVAALPEGLRGGAANARYSVQSRYFMAEVEVRFGQAQLRYQALLDRNGTAVPDVIWMKRTYARA